MSLVFILDNVRSAFNVGSIFRIADAVGAEVYVCGISPTPEHPKVAKTALGAEKSVKWRSFGSVVEAASTAKKCGYSVCAVEMAPKAKDLFACEFPKQTALIFGHEVSGVSEEVMKSSEKIVKIPMHGKKKSLNVSVSVGVAAYEVLRQWRDHPENQKE